MCKFQSLQKDDAEQFDWFLKSLQQTWSFLWF